MYFHLWLLQSLSFDTLMQAYMGEIGEHNLEEAVVGLDIALQTIPEDDRHREHSVEMLITRAECHLNLGHPLDAVSDCCQVRDLRTLSLSIAAGACLYWHNHQKSTSIHLLHMDTKG